MQGSERANPCRVAPAISSALQFNKIQREPGSGPEHEETSTACFCEVQHEQERLTSRDTGIGTGRQRQANSKRYWETNCGINCKQKGVVMPQGKSTVVCSFWLHSCSPQRPVQPRRLCIIRRHSSTGRDEPCQGMFTNIISRVQPTGQHLLCIFHHLCDCYFTLYSRNSRFCCHHISCMSCTYICIHIRMGVRDKCYGQHVFHPQAIVVSLSTTRIL